MKKGSKEGRAQQPNPKKASKKSGPEGPRPSEWLATDPPPGAKRSRPRVGRFTLWLELVGGVLAVFVALNVLLPCTWKFNFRCPPPPPAVRVTDYNGPDEWVELTNEGGKRVDLTRWQVEDLEGDAYTFLGFGLDAGESVVVHTGHGTDTDTDVFWGRNDNVWNNEMEQVFVRDPEGNEIDHFTDE